MTQASAAVAFTVPFVHVSPSVDVKTAELAPTATKRDWN